MNPFEHHYADTIDILERLRTIRAPHALYARLDAKFLPPPPPYARFYPVVRIAIVCLFLLLLSAIKMAKPGEPLYAVKIAGMHAVSTLTSFFSAKPNSQPAIEVTPTPTLESTNKPYIQASMSGQPYMVKTTATPKPARTKPVGTTQSIMPTVVNAVPTLPSVPNNPGVLGSTPTPQSALQVQAQIHIPVSPTPQPEAAEEEEKPLDVSVKIGNNNVIGISL